MREVGERVGAGGPVVVARRYLRRRLVVDLVLLGFAVLFLGAGIGGFGYLGVRSSRLAHNGIVATATAVDVDNYTHRFQFDAHVVVTFRVAGVVVRARCYTGPSDQYVPGQPVVIVYDPADPTVAQLAGDPQLGPAGVPFFALTVLGIITAAPAAYHLWVRRGAGRALDRPGRELTATRDGRRTRIGGQSLRLHGKRPDGTVVVFVARTVVTVQQDRVAYGRE